MYYKILNMILIFGLVLNLSFSAPLDLNPTTLTETDFELVDEKYVNEIDDVKAEIDTNTAEVELKNWDEETTFRMGRPEIFPALSATADKTNEEVIKESPDVDLKFYIKEIDGMKAFEYEIILKRRPSTNVFRIPVETEGLIYYYQPALTEEIEQIKLEAGNDKITCSETQCLDDKLNIMASRPENVVGSYAVYHVSKRNNEYMAGKAFHIFRPEIIDALDNRIWGEMLIENGILSITVDSKWLDTANYPVIVDPTFGYSTIGASYGWVSGLAIGPISNPGESGTVTSFHSALVVGVDREGKCAVYTLDGSYNGVLVNPEGNLGDILLADNGAWTDFTVNATLSISSGSQAPVVLGYANSVYRDSGSGANSVYKIGLNEQNPFPATISPFSTSTNIYSVYATYTASGGGGDDCTITADEVITALRDCTGEDFHIAGAYEVIVADGIQILADRKILASGATLRFA